jgi:hypothetical protein
MLRAAKTLIDLCTERFPSPRSSQHHNLVVKEDRMVLTLMQGDTYQSFNLDDNDLDKDPHQLVAELEALLAAIAAEPPPDAPVVEVPARPIPDDIA